MSLFGQRCNDICSSCLIHFTSTIAPIPQNLKLWHRNHFWNNIHGKIGTNFTRLIMLFLPLYVVFNSIYFFIPHYFRNHHQPIKYHYFQGKPTPTECGTYKFVETAKNFAHRFMTEKAVFAKWGAQYNVSFYHPYWNISREAAKTLNTPFIMNQKKKKKSPVHKKVIRRGRKN